MFVCYLLCEILQRHNLTDTIIEFHELQIVRKLINTRQKIDLESIFIFVFYDRHNLLIEIPEHPINRFLVNFQLNPMYNPNILPILEIKSNKDLILPGYNLNHITFIIIKTMPWIIFLFLFFFLFILLLLLRTTTICIKWPHWFLPYEIRR